MFVRSLKEANSFKKLDNGLLSAWNSSIAEYFRAGNHKEVLRIYLNLRREHAGIHGFAITFAFKSSVVLGAYEFGVNLHVDALKSGLNCDRYVGSSLIGFYSTYDQIVNAAKVFDEIPNRDIVTYTSIISAYGKASTDHCISYAFRVAYDMQLEGFDPNRVTLVSLLQCSSRLGVLNNGKSIHGYAVRREIGCNDEVFQTSLMHMYIKCCDPVHGKLVFNDLRKKAYGVGPWNVMITSYLENAQPFEAFNLFFQMVVNKCELDLIALSNGLWACAELCDLLAGKMVQAQILRRGYRFDLIGTTALIDMYSKCNDLSSAENIFLREDKKDDGLYNVMISGYLCNGSFSKAIETFREMVSVRIIPNAGTLISILSALSKIRTSKCIHGYIFRHGMANNVDISNQFIDTYAKCGFIEYARRVFYSIKFKDTVSWTSMMKHSLIDEAIALYSMMQRENRGSDVILFTCLVQALNNLGSIKALHGRIIRILPEKDTTLINTMITIYSKSGDLHKAITLFKTMPKKHLCSFNTMISAYGMHGKINEALNLVEVMKHESFEPDNVTFKSILSACSHAGLVEEGLRVFNEMYEKYGVIPLDEHYCCIVDLLGRTGKVEEGYDILKNGKQLHNISALCSLLSACRMHGNWVIGEEIGRELMLLDRGNVSVYCSVSNMYAGGGRWDDVARVGVIAKVHGLKRVPGYSLVQ